MGSLWSKKEEQESSEVRAERKRQKGQAVSKALFSCNPYVLKRVSSMYFDEDGDLAHEFYEEYRVQSERGLTRWTMKRLIHSGIRPQGEIPLSIPRLHVDLPVVLIENV